ncbi:hypothetical protein [Microbacterium aurum]
MTSESPPEAGEWIRLHNNTHMQVRLVIAGVIVAVVASLIPVRVAGAVGLYISPNFYEFDRRLRRRSTT